MGTEMKELSIKWADYLHKQQTKRHQYRITPCMTWLENKTQKGRLPGMMNDGWIDIA